MSFDDDDDIVFPWEEGAPPAKHPINFEVASNPEKIKPTARKAKRSSILKSASDSASDRTALQVDHRTFCWLVGSHLEKLIDKICFLDIIVALNIDASPYNYGSVGILV